MGRPSSKSAFESLAIPLLDFLTGLAMQFTRDRDRAEDLVQESVLKAYRSFDSFQQGTNFRAWIARILTNTFLTQNRHAKIWEDGLDLENVPAPENRAVAEPGTVRKLSEIPSDVLSDEVLTALHELPGEMGLSVYLADVEELPYAEIAEITQVPVGTVRSRVARGRQHLQHRLLDVAGDSGIIRREQS